MEAEVNNSAALLGLVVTVGYGHWAVQALTGVEPELAAYIAQGVQTCILFMLLGRMSGGPAWRPVCAFGAAHGGAQALCGLAYIARPITPAPWDNLADAQTGLPLTRVTLCAALILAAAVYEREMRCHHPANP